MPIVVTIKVSGAERIIATMRDMGREPVTQSMLRSIGMLAVRSTQRGIRAQISPDGAPYPAVTRFGQSAQRMIDSARLVNSITYEVTGQQSVVIGTNVDYAPAQNFGGTWGPKKAKMMAIPLSRKVARAYVAGTSIRDQYPEAFVFRSGSQGVFLVRKQPGAKRGSKKQLEFLFKLVPSITIQGTHFLDRISDEGEMDIQGYVEATMLKRAESGGEA